jgi:3-hydroxyisobutyrate dehydrogenase-like beta-hydroxyacid dehydrogenase
MGGLRVRFHLNCPDLLVLADIKGLVSGRWIAAFAKQFAARMRKTQQAPSSGLRIQRYVPNGRTHQRGSRMRHSTIDIDSTSALRPAPGAGTPTRTGEAESRHPQAMAGVIGFVGLGHMGNVMAANLAAAGCKVRAYIRHPERVAELTDRGLEATTDIADLFACDFVITMLPDDKAVREIVFGRDPQRGQNGLSFGLKPGAIHLSMSTISTAAASEAAAEHARCNQGYVAAPVFGNPDAAKARELYVIAAGTPADLQRCQPIFDILGQRCFVVGTDPASANLIKLAGNVMTGSTLELLGELFALVRKRGLDPAQFLDIMTSSMFGSRVHKIYGDKLAAQRYAASGFVIPLALKDVRLALAEAEAASVPMPSISVVRDRLIAGIARGYSTLDWSALGLIAAEEAGLPRDNATGIVNPTP